MPAVSCSQQIAHCRHPLPFPPPFSKARQAPNKGANSVHEERRSWGKCSVSIFSFTPMQGQKGTKQPETYCFNNATLPRLSLRKSAKRAQLAPSPACSDVYGMDRDIFSANQVPSLLLRLGQLPEKNFSDQTSDLEKPSL